MTAERDDPRFVMPWPLVAIIMLGMYVASTGPMARLVRQSGVSPGSFVDRVIFMIYWPIQILVDLFPAVETAMLWYVDLFVP